MSYTEKEIDLLWKKSEILSEEKRNRVYNTICSKIEDFHLPPLSEIGDESFFLLLKNFARASDICTVQGLLALEGHLFQLGLTGSLHGMFIDLINGVRFEDLRKKGEISSDVHAGNYAVAMISQGIAGPFLDIFFRHEIKAYDKYRKKELPITQDEMDRALGLM